MKQVATSDIIQTRTYDLSITYDKYYQTPRLWLTGYNEVSPIWDLFAAKFRMTFFFVDALQKGKLSMFLIFNLAPIAVFKIYFLVSRKTCLMSAVVICKSIFHSFSLLFISEQKSFNSRTHV